MKIITAFLLMFALASCSHSNDKEVFGEHQEGATDITDYSLCDTGSAHSPEGSWEIDKALNGVHFILSFQIESDSITLIKNCRTQSHSLWASVTSAAIMNSSSIEVLETQTDHEEINEDDFQMSCDADLKQSKMAYSFKGSCLVLSYVGSNEVITLIPTR